MCKVKSGAQIRNWQDVQNLVVGIILRQQQEYRIENIIKLVQHYLDGSSIVADNHKIHKIVSDNLDFLYLRNKVRCRNGCYTPLSVKYN